MSAKAIIYIVDDNSAVRDSLAVLMAAKGLETRSFASGREFLDAVAPVILGCLLIDFQLPDLDGLAVIEELKVRNIHLPAILITGHSDEYVRRRVRVAGVVALVVKPFVVTNVMDWVEVALAHSERGTVAGHRSDDSEVTG